MQPKYCSIDIKLRLRIFSYLPTYCYCIIVQPVGSILQED